MDKCFVRSVIFEPASRICAATASGINGRHPTLFLQTRVKLSQFDQFSFSPPVFVTSKRLMQAVLGLLSVKFRVIHSDPFVCHSRVMTETVTTTKEGANTRRCNCSIRGHVSANMA